MGGIKFGVPTFNSSAMQNEKLGITSTYQTPAAKVYQDYKNDALGRHWGNQEGQTYMNGRKFQQTFDANGFGNGGYYVNEDGSRAEDYQMPTTPSVTYNPNKGPASIESYTNQPLKPTAQATPAPQTGNVHGASGLYGDNTNQGTSTPAAVANAGAGPMADFIMKMAQEQEANKKALQGQISSAANPYGTDTEAYRRGLNSASNTLIGQQNHDQALASGRIGGLAGGLRYAHNQATENDQRAGLANLEAGMYGAERDRANAYENNRQNALMQLANGDYSGAASLYSNLMNTQLGQYNTDRNFGLAKNADARAESSTNLANQAQGIENDMNRIKLQYAPEMAKLGLSDAQIQNKLQQYELSDNEWDRANPIQAFLRDMGIAAAGGAGNALGTAVAKKVGG